MQEVLAAGDFTSDESRQILSAVGLQLRLAARLADIRNDVNPVIEVRRRIPQQIREELNIPPEPKGPRPTNRCQCRKVISGNKIRCLACQAGWLQREQQKASKEHAN